MSEGICIECGNRVKTRVFRSKTVTMVHDFATVRCTGSKRPARPCKPVNQLDASRAVGLMSDTLSDEAKMAAFMAIFH